MSIKMLRKRTRWVVIMSSILVTVVAFALFAAIQNRQADASAHASNFNPGRIIDDAVFYNNGSMTVNQIQAFLNSKVPKCDTQGAEPAWDWGRGDITRATLASYIRNGTHGYNKDTRFHAPPYTCLRDFKQDTPQVAAASGLCGSLSAKTNRTAAQIIKDVSDACGINPQVLLVLLNKEQSLVTDVWPLRHQYNRATGFACPDNAGGACDPAYNGFFRQVYSAARQFKVYRAYPNNYGYIAGRTNFIYWHPDLSRCGGSNVFIQNQATAGLYIYTPYRPNQAALNNYPGTGDSCSSYGNRNFWFMFTNWFGSTHSNALQITRSLWVSPSKPNSDDTLFASFIMKNTSNYPITVSGITVALRDNENNNVNFESVRNLTLSPGEEYQYYKSRKIDSPGKYTAWIATRLPSGSWVKDWPTSSSGRIVRDKTFTVQKLPYLSISRSMYFSRSGEYTTEDESLSSFVIKNNEPNSVTVPGLRVAAEHESGDRLDFPDSGAVTLGANDEFEYFGRKILTKPGKYNIWIEVKTPDGKWSKTWPRATTDSIVSQREVQINSPPEIKVSRHLYVNSIVTGQDVGASIVLKNEGKSPATIKEVRIRAVDSKGNILDFPSDYDISLNPGEEFLYYRHRKFNSIDSYRFYPVAKVTTETWTRAWPKPNDGVVINRTYSSRLPDISLIRNMYFSPGSSYPSVNQQTAVSFVVRNNESRPITLPKMTVAVRGEDNSILDYPYESNVEIAPGETYEYYQYRSFNKKGKYKLQILMNTPDGRWSVSWPTSTKSNITRQKNITVL